MLLGEFSPPRAFTSIGVRSALDIKVNLVFYHAIINTHGPDLTVILGRSPGREEMSVRGASRPERRSIKHKGGINRGDCTHRANLGMKNIAKSLTKTENGCGL